VNIELETWCVHFHCWESSYNVLYSKHSIIFFFLGFSHIENRVRVEFIMSQQEWYNNFFSFFYFFFFTFESPSFSIVSCWLVVNYEAIWNVLSCTKKRISFFFYAVVEGEIFSLIKIATFCVLHSVKIQSDSLSLKVISKISFVNFLLFKERISFIQQQQQQ
jgi:hypothetical protein